jgi:hypothetical protein
MIEAGESVQRFISNRRRWDLESDQILLFAVVRAIEVLGEAATKVSEDMRCASREIPSRQSLTCATGSSMGTLTSTFRKKSPSTARILNSTSVMRS